jgi:hypothetical protein
MDFLSCIFKGGFKALGECCTNCIQNVQLTQCTNECLEKTCLCPNECGNLCSQCSQAMYCDWQPLCICCTNYCCNPYAPNYFACWRRRKIIHPVNHTNQPNIYTMRRVLFIARDPSPLSILEIQDLIVQCNPYFDMNQLHHWQEQDMHHIYVSAIPNEQVIGQSWGYVTFGGRPFHHPRVHVQFVAPPIQPVKIDPMKSIL